MTKLVSPAGATRNAAQPAIGDQVELVMAGLKRLSSKRVRDGLARYGIPSDRALGVSMANIQKLAKRLGRNHRLAAALWDTGCFEARMLTAYVDEPARVTPGQMDRWARDFDSWAICDTLCFGLFDRTPHAWAKAAQWSDKRSEFVKRAAYALMACLALHDKSAPDKRLLAFLPLIEQGARDERNFVKKAVSWALRAVGRRSQALNAASLAVSRRLAKSEEAGCRWVGKDAHRELSHPKVQAALARRKPRAKQ